MRKASKRTNEAASLFFSSTMAAMLLGREENEARTHRQASELSLQSNMPGRKIDELLFRHSLAIFVMATRPNSA
jgi:hypothetical protein